METHFHCIGPILRKRSNSSSACYKITLVQCSKQELAHQSMKFYWGLDKETDMNIFWWWSTTHIAFRLANFKLPYQGCLQSPSNLKTIVQINVFYDKTKVRNSYLIGLLAYFQQDPLTKFIITKDDISLASEISSNQNLTSWLIFQQVLLYLDIRKPEQKFNPLLFGRNEKLPKNSGV